MNLRKFFFIITIFVSSFLFVSGIGIMNYINAKDNSVASINDSNEVNNIFKPYLQFKEPFNVLILGGDKASGNSDTMMILNFNPATSKINIMSIPRDTKVKIKNKNRKINYAYPSGGVELAAKTVSELMNVKIKYYVYVDTSAFKRIIDILGGVQIDIPADMDYDDPNQDLHIHLKKGLQTLNGEQAEQFVRFRHPNRNAWSKELKKYYDGGDLRRIVAQQTFLNELVKQKLTLQYIPKMNSIIRLTFENIETNFSLNEILKLSGFATKMKAENVSFIPMPGTTYNASPWYYLCDVEETRKIMAEQFLCDESFIDVDLNSQNSIADDNNKAERTTKSSTSSKSSTKKNNPSNSDSSLKGNQTPEP